jgi:hypothetical protein
MADGATLTSASASRMALIAAQQAVIRSSRHG